MGDNFVKFTKYLSVENTIGGIDSKGDIYFASSDGNNLRKFKKISRKGKLPLDLFDQASI